MIYKLECFRKGKLVWSEEVHNLITNEGLNYVIGNSLGLSSNIAAWYCAIVETDTIAAAGMTYAVPTYTESTAYDETTRPVWTGALSGKGVTNAASPASFTMNATKTIYGASLVGGGSAPTTKGNTAGGGTLYSYAKFANSRTVYDNDELNLTLASDASAV